MTSLTVATTGTLSGLTNNQQINTIAANLATMLAGASAPTTASSGLSSLAGVWWHDTSNNVIKIRDQADTTWISAFNVDETNKFLTAIRVANLASALNEAKGADTPSATTTSIDAIAGNFAHVTGTTAITSLGTAAQAGDRRTIYFAGALVLTNGANLVIPGGANYTTAAGDIFTFRADTTTKWVVESYALASGQTLVAAPIATKSDMQTGTDNVKQVTPARALDSDGAAKAWVVFDGTAASPITPDASFNISGTITKNATGDYTINFTTPFATAKYAMSGCVENSASTGQGQVTVNVATAPTTSSIRVLAYTPGVGPGDSIRVSLVFYGRQ